MIKPASVPIDGDRKPLHAAGKENKSTRMLQTAPRSMSEQTEEWGGRQRTANPNYYIRRRTKKMFVFLMPARITPQSALL